VIYNLLQVYVQLEKSNQDSAPDNVQEKFIQQLKDFGVIEIETTPFSRLSSLQF